MAEYYGRTCGCGCGTCFETTVSRQRYLNDAHRQAHHRVRMWAQKHTIKYLAAMYGDSTNLEHYNDTYWHFYRIGITRRAERCELAHNVGSRTS